ncbi:MAG: hypothetical protein ACYTG7_23145 [Planctomycetota bacterium]
MLKSRYLRILFAGFFAWAGLLSFITTAYCADDDPVAYQVRVVMKHGSEIDAVVMNPKETSYLKDHASLDLSKYDPGARISLHYMRGMSGSMAVNVEDVKSVTRLLPLSSEELQDIVDAITKRIEKVREKDKVRLAKLKEQRKQEEKIAAEAEKARKEQKAERTVEKAEQEKIKWITRFPPDQGWGPEKKEELYRRSMVIGVYPNEEEKAFLDNYMEWVKQFEYWKILQEKEKAEQEKEEEAEKKESGVVEKVEKEEKEKSTPSKKKGGY